MEIAIMEVVKTSHYLNNLREEATTEIIETAEMTIETETDMVMTYLIYS